MANIIDFTAFKNELSRHKHVETLLDDDSKERLDQAFSYLLAGGMKSVHSIMPSILNNPNSDPALATYQIFIIFDVVCASVFKHMTGSEQLDITKKLKSGALQRAEASGKPYTDDELTYYGFGEFCERILQSDAKDQ